ncbi:MAG: Yip1 family protein [Gemmatimonadota bacterium]
MSEQSESIAPPEPVKPASWWEDYIDIFYAPSSVFERRKDSGFGIPMLVVTLLISAIALANHGAMQPILDAEFSRQTEAMMKANPQMTAEMMEKGRAIGEKIALFGGVIFIPIALLLIGLFLWVCGKFVGAKQTLGAAVMVASFSYVPRILEAVLNGVQLLVLDPSSLTSLNSLKLGVSRFMDPDTSSKIVLALVGRIDVFTIWTTVLLAIGLSVTGKVSRSQAAIGAVILWFLGALVPLLGALRS